MREVRYESLLADRVPAKMPPIGGQFRERPSKQKCGASTSQTFPSPTVKVASDVTLADTYVGLCDWHGQLVWKSGPATRVQVGEYLWAHATQEVERHQMRAAVASVATLREIRTLEVENDRQEHFRLWLWPLNDPEIAICVLARRIPERDLRYSLTANGTACDAWLKANRLAKSPRSSRSA